MLARSFSKIFVLTAISDSLLFHKVGDERGSVREVMEPSTWGKDPGVLFLAQQLNCSGILANQSLYLYLNFTTCMTGVII